MSSLLTVYIYRHGTTQCNLDAVFAGVIDPPLVEEGRKKLKEMAANYPVPEIDKLYTSYLTRTWQTGEVYFPEYEPEIIDQLHEMDFGTAEGKGIGAYFSKPEIFKAWAGRNPEFGFEDGETFLEATHRIIGAMTRIVKDAKVNGYKKIALVSHGAILGLLSDACMVSDLPAEVFSLLPNGMGFEVEIDMDQWFLDQKMYFKKFLPEGAPRPDMMKSPFMNESKEENDNKAETDNMPASVKSDKNKEEKNMIYYIENEQIRIGVKEHGAELVSLVDKKTGREYMWSGDPAYWNRVSPILFPFIGKLNHQTYKHNGVEYGGIPQHGYARDCDFVKAVETNDAIGFELRADDKWKENYPFDFLLRVGYRLEGKMVHVMWTVRNDSQENMTFSIGAHPAFIMPDGLSKNGFYVNLHNGSDRLVCGELNENGLLIPEEREYALNDGKLELSDELFDKDALIIDSADIHTVSIETPEGKPFVQLRFDTPQLGIWSPAGEKAKAPFVCIEPWFGRCDRVGYEGTLSEREYGNMAEPGHSFNKEYVIELV